MHIGIADSLKRLGSVKKMVMGAMGGKGLLEQLGPRQGLTGCAGCRGLSDGAVTRCEAIGSEAFLLVPLIKT